MSKRNGSGKGIRFIMDHVGYDGDECLIYPLARQVTGYAQFGLDGQHLYAHRYMCELVNGPPPTPAHEAAHSCGRGKLGCIHPKHLSWKTISENNLDCIQHGTQIRNRDGRHGRLTADQVARIRAMKGQKTQAAIASQFGISASTVRDLFTFRSHRSAGQTLSPSRPSDRAP